MILAINAGSSSIKVALFGGHGSLVRVDGATVRDAAELLRWIGARSQLDTAPTIGHRVVLSARRPGVEPITPALLEIFSAAAVRDPDHLPLQLELITALAKRWPAATQFACHDAAFHATLPPAARTLPIPGRYRRMGFERIGFHGLSCAFVIEELRRLRDTAAADGRVIVAHLGGGSSVTAILGGRSVDTSMGYTPAGGIMMGTRPGDLDPGLMRAILEADHSAIDAFDGMINHECGLLAVSETTADMAALLAAQHHDSRAALAIDLYCHQVRKALGAHAAVLGGVDTIVFTGGIGEHAAEVRRRACEGLAFAGVALDAGRNAAGSAIISEAGSRVVVRVMPTDEELMIARLVQRSAPGTVT